MARRFGVATLLRRFSQRPPGQTFLLITIALVVVLGMAALAVDVGDLWTTRRLMQNAADAGAVAGADALALGSSTDAITAAAKDASSHNGFADGSTRSGGAGTVSVSVHTPPTSGPYAANASAVEVDVSETQNTYFMRVLGWRSVPVSTTAVAVTLGSGSCVYSLDPTSSGAVTVGGTASVNSACGLYVDSNSSSALSVAGGGTITAPLVGVVGGTSISGGGSTPPSTGIVQFGDPLAYIAAPSFNSSACSSFTGTSLSGPTASPGTYCGGISVNGGASVTFQPGLYIIDGGGLTVNGGASISGSGVTFYLTGANSSNGNKRSYGGVTINSTATVNFSSPCDASSGGIPGILFFQDRTETLGVDSTINGASSSTYTGAIYFPTTTVNYSGNSGTNGFTLLVAKDLKFVGTTSIGNNQSCLSGPLIRDAALVQ